MIDAILRGVLASCMAMVAGSLAFNAGKAIGTGEEPHGLVLFLGLVVMVGFIAGLGGDA